MRHRRPLQPQASAGSTPPRTFTKGYIAPHPTIRKDAVDVDGFLEKNQARPGPSRPQLLDFPTH